MSKSALEDWNLLYSEEFEGIWSREQVELRRVSIILYALKQEFKTIEDTFVQRLHNLKHSLQRKKQPTNAEPILPAKRLNSHDKIVGNTGHQLNNSTLSYKIDKSPKINRHKFIRPRQLNEQPKYHIPKLDFSTANRNLLSSSDSIVVSSSPEQEEMSLNFLNIRKTTIPKIKTPLKEVFRNDNIVDSSLIIEATPEISCMKKAKHNVDQISHSKKTKWDLNKYTTLTQMFANFENPNSVFQSANKKDHDDCKKDDDDATYFSIDKSQEQINSKNKNSYLKDYDKFSETVNDSSDFVCTTKPVRRKIDKMKLPGWSCENCKKFYENLNLSPEKLKEKMNACSKHRKKDKPMDDTFKKFWDIALTPEEDATEEFAV